MLTVKKVIVKDDIAQCVFNATAAEELTLGGRVVKMDQGTVGIVSMTKVSMKVGDNKVNLTLEHPFDLEPGEYALYFNVVFLTENAYLVDDGPYKFEKEES